MDSAACGFCGQNKAAAELVRGVRAYICHDCVGEGVATVIAAQRAVRAEELPAADRACGFCAKAAPPSALVQGRDAAAAICTVCLGQSYTLVADTVRLGIRRTTFSRIAERSAAALLRDHFAGFGPDAIVTSSRTFPEYMRVDLNRTLERLLPRSEIPCVGIHERYGHETLEYATLLQNEHVFLAPLSFVDVDVGEAAPARCMGTTLWLVPESATRPPHVALLSQAKRYARLGGWHVEIAVPAGTAGDAAVAAIFDALEAALVRSASYRGKVLSLESEAHMKGTAASILVHRLAPVAREEVILPPATLELLERNVFQFAARRDALRDMGLPVKKGLLFYGPPGTGKTHTIRYLAGALPGHTTLLVTAEQVGLLADYMTLARLLSPAIVVIEDADLIAREREDMDSPCEELLLNRLLNEMDGLRENSEILFVLTTNRPETLEAALTARPGRIDQAIEFPLPDAAGRRKLARLYGKAAPLTETTLDHIVERTARVSAAFIKELMRRSAQFALDRGPRAEITLADVDAALDELLFSGGRLNAALLGALGARSDAAS